MSQQLTTQALALVPYQAAIIGAFASTYKSSEAPAFWVYASVATLGVSLWLTAAALSRNVSRPVWSAASANAIVLRTTRQVAAKGTAVSASAYVLLFAAIFVGVIVSSAVTS